MFYEAFRQRFSRDFGRAVVTVSYFKAYGNVAILYPLVFAQSPKFFVIAYTPCIHSLALIFLCKGKQGRKNTKYRNAI